MGRPSRICVGSATYDRTKVLVGTSPYLGDVGYTGILVPTEPTPDQRHRYLFRCCGVGIGPDEVCVLRSIRQLLTIAARITVGEPGDPHELIVEREVISPIWSFQDGNVSWHLQFIPPGTPPARVWVASGNPPGVQTPVYHEPGTSTQLGDVTCPGLLYLRLPPSVHPGADIYIPPAAGLPPGTNVADLGCFHDLRFPWRSVSGAQNLSIRVAGPGALVLFASIHQTDPEARLQPPAGPGPEMLGLTAGCEPEDQFAWAFGDSARYHRVGGELIVDYEEVCRG